MILRTLAFTLMRPCVVCGLIPYLLLSAQGVAAALLLILMYRGLLCVITRLRDLAAAALVLAILGESAALRSLTLLLYALLVLNGVIFRRVSADPAVALLQRPISLPGIAGKAEILLDSLPILNGRYFRRVAADPTAAPQKRMSSLLGTAGIAFLLLAVVPWLLLRAEVLSTVLGNSRLVGLVPIALGTLIYAWCAWNFTLSGRGTPGSKRPTEALVAVGLYRLSRNPMYVAIVSILLGETILFQSVMLLVYALLTLQRFRFTVIYSEEPALREKFGPAYEEYLRSVPRWLPGAATTSRRHTGQRERREGELTGQQPVKQATEEIAQLIPPGERFILVDQDEWGTQELVAGRRRIPFLEREGQYYGPPEDDETAIRELERLRQAGAGFMVFGWPAFWWLDHYAGLQRHLRSHFRCILENERLVAFDLRTWGGGEVGGADHDRNAPTALLPGRAAPHS